MVADIAGAPAPFSTTLAAARDALASLNAPRQETDAERTLDRILADLKGSKSKAAKEAARRKLEQLKAKLEALKLAAGSAAATGDAKLARKVAQDIRDACRELGRALAAAGEGAGLGSAAAALSAAPAGQAGAAAAGAESQEAGSAAPAAGTRPATGDDDLASLKSEAAGLVKDLKKIMRKLRETGFHTLDPKERAEMEKMFREAEREIGGLLAAAAPSPGMAVNISA